MKHLLE